jgi:ATP-dependent DNA ligase
MKRAKHADPAADFDDDIYALPLATEPMEAKTATTLPAGENWQYEPKWDGFRCLVFKSGGHVDLRAKSGKPLGRYFPEMIAMFRALAADNFVLDGELVIELGGRLAFDALQMRLHPAESRTRRLAAETPARFSMFDLLAVDGNPLLDMPLSVRRQRLEGFAAQVGISNSLTLSTYTRDRRKAESWLSASGGETDGVVAKDRTMPYLSGERAMVKVKLLRTADCVVGGFRYESDSDLVGSLLLGLYNDEGELDHVGFTATITDEERPALTDRLEALRQEPGFTGKAPGAPSRWSSDRSAEWQPLKPELVVEVRFDHVTGHRFRHGTKLMRWRPDKAPRQCTFEQIEPPIRPAAE